MKRVLLFVFLAIVSLTLCADLFFVNAQSQTFDGWTHLVSLKQFYTSVKEGSFPVSWVQGVGNYGLPLGQIAHQIPMYIGALFMAVTGNVFTAYALLTWTGAFLSCVTVYWFLRRHVSPFAAATAAAVFCLAPYRIANIYIRGAVPEFWASVFIPIILAGIYDSFLSTKKHFGWIYITLGTAGLALTHPMMLLVAAPLVLPYFVACWWQALRASDTNTSSLSLFNQIFQLLRSVIGGLLGLTLAGYYLIPLFLEMKYFYYGQITQGGPGSSFSFLTLANFFTETWQFTAIPGNGVRLPTLQLGVLEMGLVCIALLAFCWFVTKYRSLSPHNLWAVAAWLSSFLVAAFLALPASEWLYQHAPLLSGIQHPWRMLTALSFIPAFLAAWLLDLKKTSVRVGVVLIILVCLLRFPQIYGKNYIAFPQERYDFSLVNPHSTNMNPVWTSVSWDYPVTNSLLDIVEGSATTTALSLTSTQRTYLIDATTPIRISTNTFYFPGWLAFSASELTAPKNPVTIEYQDPDYRGVMTARLPQGKYYLTFTYQDTKIRLLGKYLTLVSMILIGGLIGGSYLFKLSKKQWQNS